MARWSQFAPAADIQLVRALHDGEDDGVAALYDAYAERLYDYCVALLDDPRSAADVVHDTLIDATRRAPRLRERDRLRPWLYAGARRRCLTHLRPDSDNDKDCPDRPKSSGREVLFLAKRHGLTGEDLGATLGLSPRRARARLKRAQRQHPEAGDLLLSAATPELPEALRHRVVHAGTDPELAGYRADIAARGGALTAEGIPRQPDAPSCLARRWVLAGGGSFAALTTAAGVFILIGPRVTLPDLHWPGERPPHSVSPVPPGHRLVREAPPPASPKAPPPEAKPQGLRGKTPVRPTPKPKTPAGVLSVTPTSVHLLGGETTATVGLTAAKGPVTWTASSSDAQITISGTSGRISAGGRAAVQVTLDRGAITPPGEATVTVTDGAGHSTEVTVTWDLSLF